MFEERQRSPGPLQLTAVFRLQMDELQGSVKQLRAFMDESSQCLQKVSVQLGKHVSEGGRACTVVYLIALWIPTALQNI